MNDLVTRFFEARRMMKQMAGQFGREDDLIDEDDKGKKGAKEGNDRGQLRQEYPAVCNQEIADRS